MPGKNALLSLLDELFPWILLLLAVLVRMWYPDVRQGWQFIGSFVAFAGFLFLYSEKAQQRFTAKVGKAAYYALLVILFNIGYWMLALAASASFMRFQEAIP